ncbi:copper resistance protein CopC [Nonomuraea fastidiosa]|jgi:methionine-rich copper-binding protein CopC|uniref:copper resistance CopC family protein n=1 Tax=Nonomuraea TaxID=83681 RepID=UPI0032557280
MAFPPRHIHRATTRTAAPAPTAGGTPAPVARLRAVAAVLAALLSACLVLAFTASPALAHDSLKRSSPAKDAEVAALDEIELEFTASVKFPFVVLHDAGGEQLPLGEPELNGPVVTAGVTQPLAPGSYTIAWRVVSSDGHPIEGEIPFSVKGSPSDAPASPPATGEAAAAPSTAAPAGRQGDAAAESAAQTGVPAWIWIVFAVLVVLGVLVWLRTARRAPEEAPKPEEVDAD